MTETEGKIMKKILIATTALVATAGVAAAEVNLSGYARFGMAYTESAAGVTDTNVVSRLRIQADANTTTDAGIGLSVRQRFQAEENSVGTGGNGARYGVSYEGLMIQMGNICGVIECMPNLYMSTKSAGVGLEGNGFANLAVSNYTAYSSGGAGATNGVEVMYNANGLGLHVMSTEGSTGFAGSYSISNITLAAAREEFDAGGDTTVFTAGLALGNGKVAVAFGDDSGTTKTVIHGGYDMAPGANLHAFITDEDAGNGAGVGVNYDLGGGAAFDAGITNTAAGATTISAGLFFSF
jgi:outer membrane protein OmpU